MRSADLNRFIAELTSFSRDAKPEAKPHPPPGLDWEELIGVLERQGLAAIVSYQLDYRFLAYVRPPPSARERLLLSFNGWVNDNLLKVQHLRRQLSEEGVPPLILLGSIAIADTFYPHIAFRPLEELDLWVRPADLERLSGAMREAGLAPEAVPPQRSIAARFANPDLDLRVWTQPPGLALSQAAADAIWERRLSAPVFGPASFRLDPADAVCAHVAAMALSGFAVPRVQLVDLREMLLRADGPEGESGFYAPKGKALRWSEVRERSRVRGLDRSLWTALRLVGELFPEVAAIAERSRPELPARVRAVLEELVVRPALNPHRTTVVRAVNAIRRRLLR